MSRFTNLTLVLSLAACEQSAPSQNPPVFPEARTAPAPAPPTPPKSDLAPEIVETKPAPAVAPVKPKIVNKPAPAAIKAGDVPAEKIWVGKPGCRPGSRIPCRWREDEDERTRPRVIRKADETVQP